MLILSCVCYLVMGIKKILKDKKPSFCTNLALPIYCFRLLQNNQLSGPVPAEIGKLLELQTLDLSGNQFDGEIPSSLGLLTRLSYL